MYKIYKKNNYFIIDDNVNTPEEYLTKDILIREVVPNVSYDIYGTLPRFGNFDYQLLNSVSIPNILKEDNSLYTVTEWVNFYTTSTGVSSSSGGGGAGDASAANQVAGNNTLTAINNKTSAQFISSTGTLTGVTQTVSLPLTDESAGTVQITGTWVGTITFEGTIDGINFNSINAVSASTSSPQSTTNVNGLYRLTPASFSAFRVNMTAFTSGSATISMRATKGTGGIFTNQILPVRIDQTIPGTTNKVNIGADGKVATNGTVFTFSTLNSSSAQLAAGATFTGTIESILNNQSFSILFFSDQNATITVNQFQDAAGLRPAQQLVFSYIAGSRFARSGVMNGNFAQVVVQNTGGVTTTTLSLDTAYGTIPSATQLNNAPSALMEINGVQVDSNAGSASAGTQRFTQSVESASGNITTQNLVPNGIATVGSSVELILNGASTLGIQTTGTYTGALSLQITNDNARWETITSALLYNAITGSYSATIASATIGLFSLKTGGFLRARLTALSAQTGTCTVTLRATNSTSLVALDTGIPFGANSIGNIGTVSTVTALGTINTSVVPGVAATHLGKAEDAVANSGDTGVFALGVRRDVLAISTSATGDYSEIATDRYGNILTKDQTRHKRTYSLAFTVAPTASATDIFQMIGSATTLVFINKINISGTQTTGGQTTITVAKRSTSNTGGASTASTMVVHDTVDAVATSVGSIYTANPITGTLVGNLRIFSLPLGAVTATTNNIVQLDFGERGKPIVLNGVAQALVIALGGVTLAGGSINVWIEFTEE